MNYSILGRLVFAATVCVAVLPVSSAQAGAEDSGASAAQGAKTWADNCARCHNMRDPQDFRADQWKVIMSHMRLRAGLTGQEARDVLKFLQQSSSPMSRAAPADPGAAPTRVARAGSASDGKAIFNQTCIACHGPDGKGAVPGVPDFTKKDGPLSKPDDVLLKHIEEGFQGHGSPMAMPARGGNSSLTDGDIGAVLGYMHKAFRR